MIPYAPLCRFLLFLMPAETSHRLSLWAIEMGFDRLFLPWSPCPWWLRLPRAALVCLLLGLRCLIELWPWKER